MIPVASQRRNNFHTLTSKYVNPFDSQFKSKVILQDIQSHQRSYKIINNDDTPRKNITCLEND